MININALKIGDRIKYKVDNDIRIGKIKEIFDKQVFVTNEYLGYYPSSWVRKEQILFKLEPITEYKEIPIEKEQRKIFDTKDLKVGDKIRYKTPQSGNCVRDGIIKYIITQGNKTYYNIDTYGSNILLYSEDIILDKPIENTYNVICYAEEYNYIDWGNTNKKTTFIFNENNNNKIKIDEYYGKFELGKKYQIIIKEIS